MFERFTVAARDTVVRSREEAIRLRHPHIGSEHLLLALLDERAGAAHRALRVSGVDRDQVEAAIVRDTSAARIFGEEDAAALKSIGIDLDRVLANIERSFGTGALAPSAGTPARSRASRLRFSPDARKALAQAVRLAAAHRYRSLSPAHLLLALTRDERGRAAQALVESGVPLLSVRTAADAAVTEDEAAGRAR